LFSFLVGFGILPALPMMARRWRGKIWMPWVVGLYGVIALINCGLALHFFWKAFNDQ
jgi:hypothetical protein